MKKMKKLLCLVLVLTLAVGLFTFPAAADNEKTSQANYPFVFVHGLMGWGERSDLDPIVPYWGMTTGSLMKYLNNKGYESYAAQVDRSPEHGTEPANCTPSSPARRLTTA